jgi:hypothetical protein
MSRLEFSCPGPSITATINGEQAFAIQDQTYRQGYMFVYVEQDSAPLAIEGRFENALIREH